MLPTKRSSPFVRTRSFQDRNAKDRADGDGPPFAKRPFTRTMSSPFQVVTPSMKGTKNPFEKLAVTPSSPVPNSLSTDYAALRIAEDQSDDIQDESMDPNKTLQMFSFSQRNSATITATAREPLSEPDDDDDADQLQDDTPMDSFDSPVKQESSQLGSRKPRLQEALEMSSRHSTRIVKEVQAPEVSNAKKKPGTENKISAAIPVDWTLKSSISITSPESLTWCDQSSPMDEIDALQHFISSQKFFSNSQNEPELDLDISPRTLILSATYHWIYPTNTPSVPQAQNISKLLKNASNMSWSDKTTITEIFSRSAEWKQSFKAIYQSFRNGSCPYFYYVGTSWTVLFQHGSVSLSGEPEALLTNSTPGLWKALKDEDINYEQLENLGGKVAVNNFSSKHDLDHMEDQDLDQDEDQDQDQDQDETSASRNHTPYQLLQKKDLSNTLLFRGQVDVHGLFSYLLNVKTSYEDGFLYQSPSLIAGVPFLNAALRRAQISKCKAVSRPVQGTDKMQKEYRVEIQGIVLPNSARDLYRAFAAQQQPTGYSCISTSDARSHGLNLRPLHSETSDADTETTSRRENALASAKSLDQFRHDYQQRQFIWLA
ncbi:MAG: hypothetical protein J3R72DRAFT_437026 [Linnemannia gamsii]|nr:MAG: hypothetical protein J3R72DRAFT_437026 [Linnemannia gamsii]